MYKYIYIWGGLCSSLNNQSNLLAKKVNRLAKRGSFKEVKEKDRGSTNKPSMLCMGKTKQSRDKVGLSKGQHATVRTNTIAVAVLFISFSLQSYFNSDDSHNRLTLPPLKCILVGHGHIEIILY